MDNSESPISSEPGSPNSGIFYFTLSVDNKKDVEHTHTQGNSSWLLDSARFTLDIRTTPVTGESSMERAIPAAPVRVEKTANFSLCEAYRALESPLGDLASSIHRLPKTLPQLSQEDMTQWLPPSHGGVWDTTPGAISPDRMPCIKLGFTRREENARAIIAEKKWRDERRTRMRTRAFIVGSLIHDIEKRMWAAKKLPFWLEPGAGYGNWNDTDSVTSSGTIIRTFHELLPVISSAESSEMDEVGVQNADEHHLVEDIHSSTESNKTLSTIIVSDLNPAEGKNHAACAIAEPDIKQPTTPTAKPMAAARRQLSDTTSVAAAGPSELVSGDIPQNTTRQNKDTTAVKSEFSTSQDVPLAIAVTERRNPRTTPPHLRKLPPARAHPLPRRDVLEMALAGVGISSSGSTTSKKASKQPTPAPTPALAPAPVNLPKARKPNDGFKIPTNPHTAGYNIAAVVKDPRAKIDVQGLKFSAWPQPVNRGDQPIQEPRAVIITKFPVAPTFAIVSRVCRNTGKIEDITIDEVRKKARVTFIDAQVAHNFYISALKGLEHITAGQTTLLYVSMDYPVDMLPYMVHDRKATRMVHFENWDKRDVECVVGLDYSGDNLVSLLTRLADKYMPGGHVEEVTVEEQGWEYFNGTILFAGILNAIAAFDALSTETQFKGCRVAFGKDP